jgi:hypothetical protein
MHTTLAALCDVQLLDNGAAAESVPHVAAAGKTVSPESTAGLWSQISFSWVTPLVSTGYRATLTLKQVGSAGLSANTHNSVPTA